MIGEYRLVGTIAVAVTLGFAAAQHVSAAPFTGGNLVVFRVGVAADGTPVTNQGEPVFIDEYTTSSGQTIPIQSIPLPTTVVGTQRRLVSHGTSTVDGLINRSPNGQWLTFAGYDANLGTTGLSTSAAGAVNRVVGRMDASGNVDTSTGLNNWAGGSTPRSVITTDGNRFLLAGGSSSQGIREADLGDVTTIAFGSQPTPTTLRHIDIFGGELFVSTGSANVAVTAAIAQIDQSTGAPTYLPGVPAPSTGTAPVNAYQFWMADLSGAVSGPDTLYVADERSEADGGGLRKYSLVGGTWMDNGGVVGVQPGGAPAVSLMRGLTGAVSGSNVSLYATRNGTTLLSFLDTTGYNGAFSGTATLLATAQANTVFKGVDFAPISGGPMGLPGDFNDDTFVNDEDLAQWRGDFGMNGESDADGDGDSDGNDFLIWQRNLQQVGATPTAVAIPEPGAAVLLGIAVAFVLRRRR